MSDFNSSLPVRTENNGDVAVKVVDGTTVSQALGVDSSGRVTVKLDDGAGNLITSQANGVQRALDVGVNVAGVQVDPRAIRALTATDVVTANQGAAVAIAGGWPVKPTDGVNSQAYTAAGEAKVSVTELLQEDHNYGTVGPSTIRTASQIGNASGAAAFNNGATDAQTVRTAANLAIAGANVSNTNPVPVVLTSALAGTPVNSYNTTAAIASGSTSNHDYAVTASKTMYSKKFWASSSGKLKAEIQTSPDGVTFTTFWVGFNSTANPNITIDLDNLVITDAGTGAKVRIIRTNLDKQAQDVYSTISGTEL